MASITYENKVALNVDPTIPDKNKCTAGDMNEIKSVVNGKQDELVSGTNIKTINDVSLLGSGNITISGGSTPTISYSSETSTDVGSTQSRAIDLDTLNVGRYIYYNKSSTNWFYFKYTKPNASTKSNGSISNTNGTDHLIGAAAANYRTIEIEMYNKTSDLATMSVDTNEALCKIILKSARPGYSSRQTYPANSQEISYFLYKSNADGSLSVGNAFDSTDSYLIDNKLTSKQDTLVSGTNIKTINNNSLLGSGNISLEATPEISIGTTTPSGDEVLWINPEDTPSGSLNPITNTYSEATDKGYSCNYLNGSVVEEGSNANGTYIKYGNGIMICTKSVSQSLTFNDTWGSLYESSLSLGNWAQEFNTAPIVNATNISASGILVESFNPAPTKTSAGSIYLARPSSGTHQANINLIAIGKWK